MVDERRHSAGTRGLTAVGVLVPLAALVMVVAVTLVVVQRNRQAHWQEGLVNELDSVLRLEAEPTKPRFVEGEPVEIRVTITNLAPIAIRLPVSRERFRQRALLSATDLGFLYTFNEDRFGDDEETVTLAPGERYVTKLRFLEYWDCPVAVQYCPRVRLDVPQTTNGGGRTTAYGLATIATVESEPFAYNGRPVPEWTSP